MLPDPILLDETDTLFLLLANASDDNTLDFSVELVSSDGSRSALPLSVFQPLSPRLPRVLTKSPWIERAKYNSPYDPVLQTIILPINAFVLHNPKLSTDQIISIRLVFDESEEGAIYLAEVGGMKNMTP